MNSTYIFKKSLLGFLLLAMNVSVAEAYLGPNYVGYKPIYGNYCAIEFTPGPSSNQAVLTYHSYQGLNCVADNQKYVVLKTRIGKHTYSYRSNDEQLALTCKESRNEYGEFWLTCTADGDNVPVYYKYVSF